MNTDVEDLATQLSGSLGADATTLRWLWPALLRALAAGQPVTPDELAAATGRDVSDVRAGLATLVDTEYDEQGRVVGHGITLNPTPHRFEVDGRQLYTWCALDTLIFPAVIGRPAHISSPCHTSGTPVRVEVTAERVVSVEPADAVVSILTPDNHAAVRSAFCNHVHFFASPTAATPWLRTHPDASVLAVHDAFTLGQQLTHTLLSDTATGSTCC
jgi:alkylmercury lyase